jgi:hypothetical protein
MIDWGAALAAERAAAFKPVAPSSEPVATSGTTGTSRHQDAVPSGSGPKTAEFRHSQGLGTSGTSGTSKTDHARRAPRNDGPAGDDAEAWRVWREDRLGDRLRLGWQRSEAVSLTWGEAEVLWHERHGARAGRYHCAGCQAPLLGQAAMALADGARVHWDDRHGLNCLISYGRRWRNAAAAGLAELGLTAPSEYNVDAAKLAAANSSPDRNS